MENLMAQPESLAALLGLALRVLLALPVWAACSGGVVRVASNAWGLAARRPAWGAVAPLRGQGLEAER